MRCPIVLYPKWYMISVYSYSSLLLYSMLTFHLSSVMPKNLWNQLGPDCFNYFLHMLLFLKHKNLLDISVCQISLYHQLLWLLSSQFDNNFNTTLKFLQSLTVDIIRKQNTIFRSVCVWHAFGVHTHVRRYIYFYFI